MIEKLKALGTKVFFVVILPLGLGYALLCYLWKLMKDSGKLR